MRVGEPTLGDHLREIDVSYWLIAKTHMSADAAGTALLGLASNGIIGVRQTECGFDDWYRDDGLWAQGPDEFYDLKHSPCNEFLRSKGYGGNNLWADFANVRSDGDDMASARFMRNADKPANIAEQDSETPWLTNQAIEFIKSYRELMRPYQLHQTQLAPLCTRTLSRYV